MLKFLSIATLVGAGLVLSGGDASASFFRKKKKSSPAVVAAPCCGSGMVGYHAGVYPNGQSYTSAPVLGTTAGAGTTVVVPTLMPAPGSQVVVPATYTQPYSPVPGVDPASYSVPTNNSGMRRFRR